MSNNIKSGFGDSYTFSTCGGETNSRFLALLKQGYNMDPASFKMDLVIDMAKDNGHEYRIEVTCKGQYPEVTRIRRYKGREHTRETTTYQTTVNREGSCCLLLGELVSELTTRFQDGYRVAGSHGTPDKALCA